MIPRYSKPEMERIWTVENRYECWLEVELAAARAMFEKGIIPKVIRKIFETKTYKPLL